jgi:hypothetical protein
MPKMNLKLVLTLASLVVLTACNKEGSQLVVLYKDSVAPGNSVVEFLSKDDDTGQFATVHCENLKELYKSRDKVNYLCSTIVFEEFKPAIK